jgi:hypothetical protein
MADAIVIRAYDMYFATDTRGKGTPNLLHPVLRAHYSLETVCTQAA